MLRSLKEHKNIVWAVAVTPDDRKIISESEDHTIRVRDLEKGKLLRLFKGQSASVMAWQ